MSLEERLMELADVADLGEPPPEILQERKKDWDNLFEKYANVEDDEDGLGLEELENFAKMPEKVSTRNHLKRSALYQKYLDGKGDLALEVATQYGNIDPHTDEEDLGEEEEAGEDDQYESDEDSEVYLTAREEVTESTAQFIRKVFGPTEKDYTSPLKRNTPMREATPLKTITNTVSANSPSSESLKNSLSHVVSPKRKADAVKHITPIKVSKSPKRFVFNPSKKSEPGKENMDGMDKTLEISPRVFKSLNISTDENVPKEESLMEEQDLVSSQKMRTHLPVDEEEDDFYFYSPRTPTNTKTDRSKRKSNNNKLCGKELFVSHSKITENEHTQILSEDNIDEDFETSEENIEIEDDNQSEVDDCSEASDIFNTSTDSRIQDDIRPGNELSNDGENVSSDDNDSSEISGIIVNHVTAPAIEDREENSEKEESFISEEEREEYRHCIECEQETIFPLNLSLEYSEEFICDSCILNSQHQYCGECEECHENVKKLSIRWNILDQYLSGQLTEDE